MFIWLLLVFLILVVCYIIFKWKYESRIISKLFRTSIEIVLFFIITPAIAGVLLNEVYYHEDKIDEGKFRQQVRDAMLDRGLDTKEIEEIIASKYKNIFETTDDEAKQWAKNYLNSLTEKQQSMNSLNQSSKDLGNRFIDKWNPVIDYILRVFDERIEELEVRNLIDSKNITKIKEIDDIIQVENPNLSKRSELRFVKFPNGNTMQIILIHGAIQGGKILSYPFVDFTETINGIRYSPINIGIYSDFARITQFKEPERSTGESYESENDVLGDSNFRKFLVSAINHSLEYVYTEDTTRNNE